MIWAIGDIQGCYDPFMRLLDKIEFNPNRDRLWLVGDIVNRGKKSKEVLAYLYEIKESVDLVLGNHDIALLAIYWGFKKPNETIEPILKDDMLDRWIEWLRSRPLLHLDKELGYAMAHAGVAPQFSIKEAMKYNNILQTKLTSSSAKEWLKEAMSREVTKIDKNSSNIDKEIFALSSFTRMRYCKSNGELDFNAKGTPTKKQYNLGLYPWFELPIMTKKEYPIIFGHWSTLGYLEKNNIIALDSGCLWAGSLTARQIDTKTKVVIQELCPEGNKPK